VRVVFLTHNYPRNPGDLAGSFLATLGRGLVRRGVDVRVVAPSDAGEGGEETMDGVTIRRVRYASPQQERIAYRGSMASAIRSPAGLRALAGLWRALRSATREELDGGADLVHAHWWVPGGLAVPPGARYILTSHGTDAALLRRSRLARRLARPVYQRASLVTAVSRELAGWIEEGAGRHVPKGCIQPMPIETGDFGWSEGGGGIVVVARLSTQKRVGLAIRAVASLHALGAPVPLTIAGDGPERAALEALAMEQGIGDHVRFLGSVSRPAVATLLRSADLMLFTAQGEGFGLSAAEAMMSGVPVVACWDGGGVLDVVPDGGAGRRVLPAVDAVADAALDLLGDPARHQLAREHGTWWRERLHPDKVAETCEGWYREALGA
jgi:glycosyltransferase involved in cell wall biosynthesis